MPQTLTETLPVAPPQMPPRKRWTRAECAEALAAGLWAGQHLELIEGELFDKMGKNQAHVLAVAAVLRLLMKAFDEACVLTEAPITVSASDDATSEPEPDVLALNSPVSQFRHRKPKAADVALLIEVADSSLRFDLTTKAHLYARAGIADYWVLDLNSRRLVVHREPVAGAYQSVMAFAETETVAPLAAPAKPLPVAALLG